MSAMCIKLLKLISKIAFKYFRLAEVMEESLVEKRTESYSIVLKCLIDISVVRFKWYN